MKKNNLFRLVFVYGAFILLGFALLFGMCSPRITQSARTPKHAQSLRSIAFEGAYSLDGDAFKPLEAKSVKTLFGRHSLVVRGRFLQPLTEGETLMMRLCDLSCRIWIDGVEVYASIPDGGEEAPVDTWAQIQGLHVTPEAKVEIQLNSFSLYGSPAAFYDALYSMQAGEPENLLFTLLRQNISLLIVGVFDLVLGCTLLLVSAFSVAMRMREMARLFYIGLYSLALGVWMIIDMNYLSFFFDDGTALMELAIVAHYLILLCIIGYAASCIQGRFRLAMRILYALILLFSVAATAAYFRLLPPGFDFTLCVVLLDFTTVPLALIFLVQEGWGEKNAHARRQLPAISMLVLGAFWDYVLYFSGHGVIGGGVTAFSISFILFQLVDSLRQYKADMEAVTKAQEIENELTQERIAIMLSQIQPHFLYNALIVIKQLCDIDPKEAKIAVVQFSKYLRANMDSLKSRRPIRFEKELDHVQNYLALEKKRFGDRLNVVYDIQESNFVLPTLSLQPLVENAVRYGVMRRSNGGTVTISTLREADHVLVVVTDDGVGYDPMQVQYDGRSHIGIENVRSRLKALCDGSMTIESTPGKGTRVTLHIPVFSATTHGS